MKRMFLTLLVSGFVSSYLPAQTLAQIGQDIITKNDVLKFKDQLQEAHLYTSSMTNDFLIQHLIDYKLTLKEAHSQMIEQEQGAKDAMERSLYAYYLNKLIDNKYKNKKFSDKEIATYYSTNPIMKIQRLVYAFNPSSKNSMERAKAQISVLRSEIKAKKISFDNAIERVADNSPLGLSGTFDKVALFALPPAEVVTIKDMQPLELSPVITFPNCYAITKILKIYPITSEYADSVNKILRDQAVLKAREKYFQSLRQKYSSIIKTL